MKRPPVPRSLLVEHPALPQPFGVVEDGPGPVDVGTLGRQDRLRVAIQLTALTALLAEFELWPGRHALRRAEVVATDGSFRAAIQTLPLPLSRLWSSLGGGEIAAELTRNAALSAVAELTDLVSELAPPARREPGFALEAVIERLLDELPRPLDPVTARSLWMVRWSLPPAPENGDVALYALDDETAARRVGAALWAATARAGGGATLELVDSGSSPLLVARHGEEPRLRVVAGSFDEARLGREIDEGGGGATPIVVLGRFPDGWTPPRAPVFDGDRLPVHLALVGIPLARRLRWLDRQAGGFDRFSEDDRRRLTRSAAFLFAEPRPRRRGRFRELVRVTGLLPEGLPLGLACEIARCDEEHVAAAETENVVVLRRGRIFPPTPVTLTVDPLHADLLPLFDEDDPRHLLHGALATGDTGPLLAWSRAALDDLREREVRRLLVKLAPGALGPGVQVALAEACLSLADVHGARCALAGLAPEMARPWSDWLQLIDRPPDLEVRLPGDAEIRHAPRASAEIALVVARRSLRWGGEDADEPVAAVRSSMAQLEGASRRWVEIRLVALTEPALLDDPKWRRSQTGGHPELVGLALFERSVRAMLDGRPRFARRLLTRVMGAERSPGRLALMQINLGALELDEGHSRSAEALTLRAYRLFQAAGFRHRTWEVLHNLAVADIDQLRVRRAAERLDQVAQGRDSLFVDIERARLALAVGNLREFRSRLDELPSPAALADPSLVEALSLLHGVRHLLFGSAADASSLLAAGGQEARAWLDLASALTGDRTPRSVSGEDDPWGVHRAAALVPGSRELASEAWEGDTADGIAVADAMAVALVRFLGVRRDWPGRRPRTLAAESLARHGLTGWAARTRWNGPELEELLAALSGLARGRDPETLTADQIETLLGVLGVSGVAVRSATDGRRLWQLGVGRPLSARVRGRLEMVPLGREPVNDVAWTLLADLLDQTAPTVATPVTDDGAGEVRIDGSSALVRRLREEVKRAAGTRFTILIHGETGSGKEVVAREIHRLSDRRGDLVSVNVAAIPVNLLEAELFGSIKGAFTGAERSRRGLVTAADGGTLFLDEVGDLDAALQIKLLRFLESGEVRAVGSDRSHTVDARVVCATHRNLERRVREGLFRQDLYYRIAIARVQVPALRDRPEDIPVLREVLEREAAQRHGLTVSRWSAEAGRLLMSHPWPGNVRELKHTVEVAMARAAGETIRPEHLPFAELVPTPRGTWEQVLSRCKRRLLEEVLTRHGGNRSAASRELGISRQALLYQLKVLGLTDL